MTSLVDDIRDAPTPQSLETRHPLVSLVKEAQAALLRASVQLNATTQTPSLATDLRRYAIWLDHALLSDNYSDTAMLELASSLYEFSAELTPFPPTTIFRPPLNDQVRSAILASLTPFQGRASIVAGRVASALERMVGGDDADHAHLQASQVITALLARRFHDCIAAQTHFRHSLRLAIEELQRRDAPTEEFVGLDIAARLAKAASRAASGMLTGADNGLPEAIREATQARQIAANWNDANQHWLADRLQMVLSRMRESSMHHLLGDPHGPVPERYRQTLVREGFLELWGPQIEAIRNGILEPQSTRNFVLSIPTGSGKSLLAELAILASLHETDGWALYVASSRSLVNQASHELRRHLQTCGFEITTVLAGTEQSILISEEIELLTAKKAIVVTTPEKLDSYLRNAPHIFQTCKVMVVDEAHKLAEQGRGPLLESLVTQFLILQHESRIVLMSGVMSNAEELASWIENIDSKTILFRRKATRQVFGVAVRQKPNLKEGPTRMKRDKFGILKEIRRAEFSGGIVLVNDQEDLSTRLEVQLPNVFKGHYTERRRGGGWTEDKLETKSTINDHAVAIAQSVSAAPGTVLVFVNDTRWAESCARKVSYVDDNFRAQRNELALFVELEVGDDHELAELCRRGVAFHHARLPSSVQRAIEFALERGWLKVVFATSSLREGLNTPATTVVVAGLSVWDGEKASPISPAAFANMAGRAGRPRYETEGRVILIPNSLAEASAIEAGREYILTGEAALRVRSQLGQLRSALANAGGSFLQLPVAHQRLLLGLKATSLDDRESLGLFFGRTLWAYQVSDDEEVTDMLERASESITAAEELYGERLGLAARVGLSLTSSELLRERILESRTLFERVEPEPDGVRDSQLTFLVANTLDLGEIQDQISGASKGPEAIVPALRKWISGARYGEILVAGRSSGLFKHNAKSSEAVRFCSDASNWLSWAFGAAWSIIEAEIEDPDPCIGLLPLFVRYGVPTASAAYVSLLGVADRSAAQVLGYAFDESGQAPTLQSVSSWMGTIDVDIMFPNDRHYLRAELLRRQSFRAKRSDMPFFIAEFESLYPIPFGTELRLLRRGRALLLTRDESEVGEILSRDAGGIGWMMNKDSPPLVSVVKEQTATQRGAVIAIPQ